MLFGGPQQRFPFPPPLFVYDLLRDGGFWAFACPRKNVVFPDTPGPLRGATKCLSDPCLFFLLLLPSCSAITESELSAAHDKLAVLTYVETWMDPLFLACQGTISECSGRTGLPRTRGRKLGWPRTPGRHRKGEPGPPSGRRRWNSLR